VAKPGTNNGVVLVRSDDQLYRITLVVKVG
jgi:hypothetical protein